MITTTRVLLLTCLVSVVFIGVSLAVDPPAEEETGIVRQLDKTPNLDTGKRSWNGHPQIHRVKTAAAFKRLGGEDLPLNFDSHDLVVVSGSLGCAHGKVEFKADESTVTFSVKITERCTHRTMQLHHFPYSGAFAIGKDTRIASSVFVGPPRRWQRGQRAEKLANTGASHLNLSGYQVTDEDLEQLKKFHNLTHLYLANNKITDKGLANLSHMTGLLQLFLDHNAGITDVGIDHLRPIVASRIQILGVQATNISHDGLKKLREWSESQTGDANPTQISHSLVTPQVHE